MKPTSYLTRPLKLLWITDLSETGYTNASRTLIKYLEENEDAKKIFEVHILGINHAFTKDGMLKYKNEIMPWFPDNRLHFTFNEDLLLNFSKNREYVNDPLFYECVVHQRYGIYDFERIIPTINPDLILSINDNGVLNEQLKTIDTLRKKYEGFNPILISYMPIDCFEFPKHFFDELLTTDEMITMTNFGRDEILKTGYNKNIHVLNHSIDNENFYPLSKEERVKAREEILDIRMRNRFIILNSNKNQNRKRLDITIDTYKKLIDRNLNVGLVLKTSVNKSVNNGGINLDEIMKSMSPIYKNGIQIIDERYSLEKLNRLYNAIDVNINTSIGEGWGIVPCEVSLCEVPQLVPNSTSYPEIFDRECLVDCEEILRVVGMTEMNIDENSFNCILKGSLRPLSLLKSEDDKYEITPHISVCNDPGLYNIMISEKYASSQITSSLRMSNGMMIAKICKDVKDLDKFIIENKKKIQNFQIICQNGKNMNELRESGSTIIDYLDGLNIHFKLKSLDPNRICRLTVKVGVPMVNNFADKIEALYKFPDLRRKIGKKCRERILNEFNINKIGEKIFDILIGIINKPIYKDRLLR